MLHIPFVGGVLWAVVVLQEPVECELLWRIGLTSGELPLLLLCLFLFFFLFFSLLTLFFLLFLLFPLSEFLVVYDLLILKYILE